MAIAINTIYGLVQLACVTLACAACNIQYVRAFACALAGIHTLVPSKYVQVDLRAYLTPIIKVSRYVKLSGL